MLVTVWRTLWRQVGVSGAHELWYIGLFKCGKRITGKQKGGQLIAGEGR